VRCGLLVLQSVLSAATLERIHAEARQRPFASIADLCARVRLTALELERLVRAGALDRFASSRRAARWEIQVAQGRVPLQPSLLSGDTWPQPLVVAPESMVERGSEEYETLGFPVSVDHPLELYPAEVAQLRPLGVAQLPQHIGREVVVAGVVVAARRVKASTGRPMAFASICSPDGTADVTLFEAAATRYAEVIQLGALVTVRGVVTQDLERGIGLEVTAVRPIPSSGPQRVPEARATP
jgi:error-prone DNA polymerase